MIRSPTTLQLCLILALSTGVPASALAQSAEPPLVPQHPLQEKSSRKPAAPDARVDRRPMTENDMLGFLAGAGHPKQAAEAAAAIERRWQEKGGDTVNLLLDRALAVALEKRFELASKLIEASIELAPEYPEAWIRRSQVEMLNNQRIDATASIRKALAIEPRHFRALEILGRLQLEAGEKRSALDTFRRLLKIYPLAQGVRETVSSLTQELSDRGI